MTVQSHEVQVLQEQTQRFIDEKPTGIVIKRSTKTPDGAGGWTTTESSLNPQIGRIVTQRQGAGVERTTVGGENVRPDVVVIMRHDADIIRGDWFTWDGLRMDVVWVNDLGYEKMAEVSARA